MNTPAKHDPATSPPMTQEADIGSGEKTPAQKETEEMIRQIPALPADQANAPSDQQNTPSDQQNAPSDQPGIVSPS